MAEHHHLLVEAARFAMNNGVAVDATPPSSDILLLDEPASAHSHSARETEAALTSIKELRNENVSNILGTHDLDHPIRCATASWSKVL